MDNIYDAFSIRVRILFHKIIHVNTQF